MRVNETEADTAVGTAQASWLLAAGASVDHFQVIRPLGRGGMAEVYLARDTKLGRKVALKLVNPEMLTRRDAVDRFLFEARATARFNHPHIITIYAVDECEGQAYVALEYLEGQTLRERMERERPSVKESIRIGLSIAQALAEAHAHNILHRDLKPENVILTRDGRHKVLDFGLARVFADDQRAPPRTTAAEGARGSLIAEPFDSIAKGVRGSPLYMAPEQWKEEETDGAADVWALGVILHELLSGRRPYPETIVVDLADRVCAPEAVPIGLPEDLPAELSELVVRCLHKERTARPTAREAAQRLLMQVRPGAVPHESPFRGLLPFGEQHSQLFFGRETEIAAFVERLRTVVVLPVLGPSGAGKSSFVQAGVIPRLREKGPLQVLHMRPGHQPFLTLASRIVIARRQVSGRKTADSPFGPSADELGARQPEDDDPGEAELLAQQIHASPPLLNLLLFRLAEKHKSSVLLFVDQLEELHLIADRDLQKRFMQAVCIAADDAQVPVRVVFTLREDYLSRLAVGPRIRETLGQIVVLRSPSPTALQETLSRPLEATGYRFDDPDLVARMVDEVAAEASCLPLLQFAGQRLWEQRDGQQRLLRRSAYEAMGGVAGALGQHAEGVLAGLTSEEVQIAKALLLRLVTPEGARRLQSHARLLEGLDRRAGEVLRRLVTARLITVQQSEGEQPDYELAHESLALTWGRLSEWIDESREEIRALNQLSLAAELWETRGRRATDVLRGQALREANRTAAQCESVPELVHRFLTASNQRQRASAVRRVAAAALTIVLVAAAFVVGGLWRMSRMCTGSAQKLDGVWDEQRKAEVHKAFLATAQPYARDAWAEVERVLDSYATDWAAMHRETCEATRLRGEQSERLMDLRMACLAQRLNEVRALTEVFVQADRQIVEKAVRATHGLRAVAGCANLEARSGRLALLSDPGQRRRAEKIRGQLARAQALQETAKYQRGLEIATLAVDASRQPGLGALTAEAQYRLGVLQRYVGAYEQAEQSLKKAWWAAESVDHAEMAASAVIELARVVAQFQARPAEGDDYIHLAEAILERLGSPGELRASWQAMVCLLDGERGDPNRAYEQCRRAVELREKTLGPNHPLLALSLNSLGRALYDRGEFERAQQTLLRSLDIQQRLLGAEHPDVAVSLNGLSIVFLKMGRYQEALEHIQRALAIWETSLGSEHPYVAAALSNLGIVWKDLGEHDKAIGPYRRSLAIRQKLQGAEHPDVALTQHNLANVFRQMGDLDEAIALYKRSIEIWKKAYGADHPEVARSTNRLCMAYLDRGELDRAAALCRRATAIWQKRFGPDNVHVTQGLLGQGDVALSQGQQEAALAHYRRALRILEASYGPQHADVADGLDRLGEVYSARGDLGSAREHHQRALTTKEKVLGIEHPRLTRSLLGLASVELAEGAVDPARKHLERALAICAAKVCTPKRVAVARFRLAQALWRLDRNRPHAKELARQAREGFARLPNQKRRLAEVKIWLAQRGAR